jgi:hypothetical protein
MSEVDTDRTIAAEIVAPPATGGGVQATIRRKRFARHVGEMLVAMFAGMVVLGGVLAGVLAVAGTSLGDASVDVAAAAMAFNMTVPMVSWMNYRRHPVARSVEMAGSMLLPTAAVIALSWLGALSDEAVPAVQHAVMIPAMVGVMLWRYDHHANADTVDSTA